MRQMAQELADTDAIVDRYQSDKSNLIQILLEIQRENAGSQKTISCGEQQARCALSQIYHVATFYKPSASC